MPFSVKRYPAILQDMVDWIIANQDKITDLNEGSVIRSFCEAVALEIEQLYIKTRVGFDRELKSVPFYAFNFTKEGAQKASGTVKFSRTGTSGTIDIPAGTLIATADGIQFETTEDGFIQDGETESQGINIKAVEEGRDSNVPANTIDTIITPISGVEGVYNPTSTTGGQDEESDAEYLKRFQEFIEGLGKSNKAGLIAGAKSVEGVRSASVVEHFPPEAGYNVTVYIDDGAGNASQDLIDAVKSVLIGDRTSGNPGYKAGGINLRVLAPTKVTIDVAVEITDDGTFSQATIEYNVKQAIENYINNLWIGDDVIQNKIIEVIMAVSGVADLNLTDPGSNIAIGEGQIARTGMITITFA